MRSIVFDAGPIISLTVNNLLWILDPMKTQFEGYFYLPQAVKREIVDVPIRSKKYKFEALQVMTKIESGVFTLPKNRRIKEISNKIFEIANHILMAKGHYLNIVHQGELEALASCIVFDADALVIDERTTRALVENTLSFIRHIERRLGTKITINHKNLRKFQDLTKGIKMFRSTEFALVAYEMGLLDKYIPGIQHARKNLLQGVLWGLKLNGCAISAKEIDKLVHLELGK